MRATDNGSPPRHTDHSLTINILDVNDNPPVIENQKGYNVSISEVATVSYLHNAAIHLEMCLSLILLQAIQSI